MAREKILPESTPAEKAQLPPPLHIENILRRLGRTGEGLGMQEGEESEVWLSRVISQAQRSLKELEKGLSTLETMKK
jgi:hypothetical protein